MSIFTRIKNIIKMMFYKKLCDREMVKAKKHINDPSDCEFKKHANLYLKYARKYLDIAALYH